VLVEVARHDDAGARRPERVELLAHLVGLLEQVAGVALALSVTPDVPGKGVRR
jgi:hypothetical protein